ncbi:magnesium transporter [Alkalibacterium subtropicum]|uniref:Magnesium transporter MgtE n=1 Tax=Alkalibacterium subtropicum TaxID=753702 RepID=A0A1I1H1F4_9LACT|nr:magnesium transporter [Alkalibacterium subtropicum]SFC15010.1 magnesium transporter [Alkalibacterium subtropicum]
MKLVKSNKQKTYEHIFKAAKENDKQAFRELFLRLHDRDQHEVFHLLYPDKKRKISEFLTPEEFAEIFEWMETEDQEAAVQYLPDAYMAEVFNTMAADDVARFLTESDETDNQTLLDMMDDEESQRVQEIMAYEAETAGSIMTKEFIAIKNTESMAEVVKRLRKIGREAETIYYLYVIDDKERLVGVLSLRDLLLSPEDEIVENIMFNQVVSVKVSDDQEHVARVIQDYDLLAAPVLGFDGTMQGIVTVDDVMDIIEEETTEDFNEFAAISRGDEDRRKPSPLSTAKARIPWIVVLLFLGMITGGLIGIFEETLESVVLLAAFMPIMMGTAGNVGTQSLAVAVRNLTVDDDRDKDSFFQTIKNELGAGMIMGLIAGIVMIGIVVVVYGNPVLAFIIAVSMFITVSLATVIGTTIPTIINKFKIDPAVASGPFITTINDSLSLIIYFTIATMLIEFL